MNPASVSQLLMTCNWLNEFNDIIEASSFGVVVTQPCWEARIKVEKRKSSRVLHGRPMFSAS